MGSRFWRKSKYTEKSPTCPFIRSLGSFVVFGGLEIAGPAESHRWAGYQTARTQEGPKAEEERNSNMNQKFCKQFSSRGSLTHYLSMDETPKHQTAALGGKRAEQRLSADS